MPVLTIFAFLFLAVSFLSLWISREVKVIGTFLFLTLVCGFAAGHISLVGLAFILSLMLLWFLYDQKPSIWIFIALIIFSMSFKLRLIPGFNPFFITSKFAIGLENPLIGLFPLVFIVPLAKSITDWKMVMKGLFFGLVGIALLAFLAILTQAIHLHFKLPSFFVGRLFSNLILTSIPEEGFFRGFVQKTLCTYFKNKKMGNVFALVLTSLLFTAAHLYWSPNLGILAFTFLASLLYGIVYLYSGKIESAILCHFLLNLIHMTFFSYHAL